MKVIEIVEEVLRYDEEARASDVKLCKEVYARMGADVNLPFDEIMSDEYIWSRNLPSFASIVRFRRFVQEKNPSLIDGNAVQKREENRIKILKELEYNV